MRVLGISGSPRANSNSQALLDAALAPFAEANWQVQKVLLSEVQIAPCIGCEVCQQTGICQMDDEMNIVYDAFLHCNALIIAAPVYYRNVPSQLKALFDRTFAAGANPLKGKLGGAIAVGRGSGTGQSIVLSIIHNFYLSCGALCVPGEMNGVNASADKPGDILAQPRRLTQARVLGENIFHYATL